MGELGCEGKRRTANRPAGKTWFCGTLSPAEPQLMSWSFGMLECAHPGAGRDPGR